MALPIRRNRDQAARWDPLAEVNRLNEQLQDYLGRWPASPLLTGEAFAPLADLEETEDAWLVEVELPGVKGDDIDVEVTGRRLTVSGERKERTRTGVLRRQTRVVGRFHHEVVLPGEIDEEGVHASLDEGVLTVRVPKAESERPRRIPVS